MRCRKNHMFSPIPLFYCMWKNFGVWIFGLDRCNFLRSFDWSCQNCKIMITSSDIAKKLHKTAKNVKKRAHKKASYLWNYERYHFKILTREYWKKIKYFILYSFFRYNPRFSSNKSFKNEKIQKCKKHPSGKAPYLRNLRR